MVALLVALVAHLVVGFLEVALVEVLEVEASLVVAQEVVGKLQAAMFCTSF